MKNTRVKYSHARPRTDIVTASGADTSPNAWIRPADRTMGGIASARMPGIRNAGNAPIPGTPAVSQIRVASGPSIGRTRSARPVYSAPAARPAEETLRPVATPARTAPEARHARILACPAVPSLPDPSLDPSADEVFASALGAVIALDATHRAQSVGTAGIWRGQAGRGNGRTDVARPLGR